MESAYINMLGSSNNNKREGWWIHLILELYCDESRQDLLAEKGSISANNIFCCIGGIMVPSASRQAIKVRVNQLKRQHDIHNEIKWTTVSPSRLEFYVDLVDLFFATPELSFRTVVIDASKVRNNIFNNDDQELGYYKFYYQLLYHWLNSANCYRIYTDQKTNREKKRLKDLRHIINNSIKEGNPIDSIQAIDSSESVLLQMQNVLMGAVGYKYNYQGEGQSWAKESIVHRIEKHIKKSISATPASERKFNIFAINLKEVR